MTFTVRSDPDNPVGRNAFALRADVRSDGVTVLVEHSGGACYVYPAGTDVEATLARLAAMDEYTAYWEVHAAVMRRELRCIRDRTNWGG